MVGGLLTVLIALRGVLRVLGGSDSCPRYKDWTSARLATVSKWNSVQFHNKLNVI